MSKGHILAIIVSASVFAASCGGMSSPDDRLKSNTAANRVTNTSTLPTSQPTVTPPVIAVPTVTPVKTPVSSSNVNASPAERPRIVEQKKSAKAAPSNEIPSEDEMRKAFAPRPVTKDDVNDPSMMRSTPMMKSKPANSQTMKSNRKLGGKPQ